MTIALTKPPVGSTTWGTVVNQNFTNVETALNEKLHDLPGLYGDASDGNATISGGTTTLTRDMYYGTLTVASTGVLYTAGFRVYAKTSVTVDAGGRVHNNGSTPLAAPAGSIGGGGDGAFTFSFGVGADTLNSLGGNGAAGDTGVPGGVAYRASAGLGKARSFLSLMTGLFFNSSENSFVTGGAGGGSGSGGEAGGGGGGAVLLATPTLTNNGSIEAKGGDGVAAAGGGGGGGVVFLACSARSGSGTVSVAGGTGGSTAAAAGTIVDGAP